MEDLWYEGYGAGLSGCSWLRTVAGRFLSHEQRRILACGWWAGLRDMDVAPQVYAEMHETLPL